MRLHAFLEGNCTCSQAKLRALRERAASQGDVWRVRACAGCGTWGVGVRGAARERWPRRARAGGEGGEGVARGRGVRRARDVRRGCARAAREWQLRRVRLGDDMGAASAEGARGGCVMAAKGVCVC